MEVVLMPLSVWHNSFDDVHSKQGRWWGQDKALQQWYSVTERYEWWFFPEHVSLFHVH